MKKSEFDRILKNLTKLDLKKVEALPPETRKEMGLLIVRHREPLLVEFADGLDKSWLHGMGYLYTTRSTTYPEYVFYHTCEHVIR